MTRKQITALRCAARTLFESREYKGNALFLTGVGKDVCLESISYQEALDTLLDIIIEEEEKDETLSHSERP